MNQFIKMVLCKCVRTLKMVYIFLSMFFFSNFLISRISILISLPHARIDFDDNFPFSILPKRFNLGLVVPFFHLFVNVA